ncbi:MAG: TrkH family potassium uptake protein [Planctomycetes bacterium]|nr:TrkH family potassium uptake protein [Planctomycetota bacterium]
MADAWQTYAVIIPLVILGGLGYPVWHDLITRRLSLQTKIALLATAVLIVIGTLAIGRIEKPRNAQRWGRDVQYEDLAIKTDPGQMRNRDPYRRALDSLFLAVNARSGGFATVDTANGKLSPGTRSVLIALMTIGGAPASVAGGIKTVTFVVLLSAAAAAIRRRRTPAGTRPQAGASDGPRNRVVYHAAIVFFVYLAVLWFITTALAVTHPQIGFLDLAFEAASACGCVGLSTGVTPHLNLAGRLLLIVAFIFGRLAPLALLFSMAAPRRPSRLEQTDEPLMTG